MSVRKFHINPSTGDIGRCFSQANKCPFGSTGMHFYEEDKAYAAADLKLKEFHDWTSRSLVPQKTGWFTVHVFDPVKKPTLISPLMEARQGHHLVLENGWIYEKAEDYMGLNWRAIEGKKFLPNSPIEPGKLYQDDVFGRFIRDVGARIELTENMPHYEIRWPGSSGNPIR